ncbi:MAG: hypothetical protein JWP27_1990 [Flaviaesturariibacter sp.]|nr:hypothetical protein [Flaviaesturariibacter sp.]
MSTVQMERATASESFKLVPAIIMALLFLAFIASNVYVLIASWD